MVYSETSFILCSMLSARMNRDKTGTSGFTLERMAQQGGHFFRKLHYGILTNCLTNVTDSSRTSQKTSCPFRITFWYRGTQRSLQRKQYYLLGYQS